MLGAGCGSGWLVSESAVSGAGEKESVEDGARCRRQVLVAGAAGAAAIDFTESIGTSQSPARRIIEVPSKLTDDDELGDRIAIRTGEGDLLADDRAAEAQAVGRAGVGQERC